MGIRGLRRRSIELLSFLLCFGITLLHGKPSALPPIPTEEEFDSPISNTTDAEQENAKSNATRNLCTATTKTKKDISLCLQYLSTNLQELSSRFNQFVEGTNFHDSERVFVYDWRVPLETMENYALGEELISERFYIAPGGYRMFLSTFPAGDANADDSYLKYVNVFAGVARGVHDDLLAWPFVLKFQLILVDQTDASPVDADVGIDPRRICLDENGDIGDTFTKPVTPFNDGNGCGTRTLIEREEIFTRHYIKDKHLVFRLKVFLP